MEGPGVGGLNLERHDEALRKRRQPVLLPFPLPDQNLAPREINIADTVKIRPSRVPELVEQLLGSFAADNPGHG